MDEYYYIITVANPYGYYHLYESLGFKECGRIPDANKYDDGTYSDSILMAAQLK